MKVLAIVQARMSSSRLPGKVLRPVGGRSLLERQIERIKRAKRIDEVMIATSVEPSDDPIAELATAIGVPVFRGSLDDVLDRFAKAAASRGGDHVVRLTADCPLIDPELIDHVISIHLSSGSDATSNALDPTYPDGLDTEVMTMAALRTADEEATSRMEREHVTLFLYAHRDRFKVTSVRHDVDLSHFRWTVDRPEDFEFVSTVFTHMDRTKPEFLMADVLAFLGERPELLRLNGHFARNEGFARSEKTDASATGEERR